MRILVTGGAGFIGSHVVDRLLAEGDETAVLDDFNDFYEPEMKRRNIAPHAGKSAFRLYEGDICDCGLVERVFREFRPDCVVHLAARAGVRASLREPVLYERVNVEGTIQLLEAACRGGIIPFIFGSSSSVYGIRTHGPFREDDPAEHPASPYAATKRAGELYCRVYHELHGLPVTALRFFTVYGPRQRPEMAIHKFARAIAMGEPVTIFGNGRSERDYTYVDDVVDGIVAAVRKRLAFEILNLGGSETTSLQDLVGMIEELVGKRAVIERLPDQAGDVPITFADLAKSRKLLGYEPRVRIREGLERFVRWFTECDRC